MGAVLGRFWGYTNGRVPVAVAGAPGTAAPGTARRRGMVRCPRHNKTFDLATGEAPGTCEVLKTLRGEAGAAWGRWWVEVSEVMHVVLKVGE
eukprot:Skav226901  [mRNA]  locus=scaffold853:7472:9646:- [translate_table: standard]